MDLTPGSRLGSYEILAPLGAGGMGQVFRARDIKLNRPVAIKFLRDDWAHQPEWLASFEQEARLLATLVHPNIATVHELDEYNGSRYLVMELVPGQTLAERLARGPLPVDEALGVGKQIAEALEAAHARGIIHRDLKPANVMLTPDGKVKILDFGLARQTNASVGTGDSNACYEGQTGAGVIEGTAAYMSPEQARGGQLDRRCDLWAFGCVLYEALTGRTAFNGATTADILAAVIDRPPVWESLPVGLPPRIELLLRRCLQKDPQKRLRDAGDACLEFEEALVEPARRPPIAPPAPASWRSRFTWVVLTAVLALAAFALGRLRSPQAPPAHPTGPSVTASAWTGQFLLGGATRAFQPRVSPDGDWLAFIVLHEGQAQVGVMKLNSGEWWVLTRNRERGSVNTVCWANDSTRIYFDRVFDLPVGVFSASPLDRVPEGATEVLVRHGVECPQVVADGTLVVGKLEADGKYRLNRHLADGSLRPVGPPLDFNRAWPPPLRALHQQNKVVFCGKVLDDQASADQRFYLLDLETGKYRLLTDESVGGAIVPLAVSPHDHFAYSVLPVNDVFQLVRIPLAGSARPEPLMTMTAFPWGLDVDGDGRLYADQVRRSLDVLRFELPNQSGSESPVERLAASFMWREKTDPFGQPVELPDGRIMVPSKVAGRNQLLAGLPGKDPTPLLEDSEQETAPPAVMVGQNRLAFMVGAGKERRLRLAVLRDGSFRLEPVELGVADQGLSALSASSDGQTLYYVRSRQVWEVSADGSRPPRALAPGDGIAVEPTTGALVIQRFDRGGIRLFRLPRSGAALEEITVQPGPWHLAPSPICGRVIDASGRMLVVAVAKDSWFWRPALLDPAGKLRPISVAYHGDVYPAGWSKNNRVLGMGYSLFSDLWQFWLPREP